MIWIGMSLQSANTNVEHVHDVVVGRKSSASLVVFAVKRQIVVMPFTILLVMDHVLKKCVSIRVRISFADALFNGVGPGGDTGERFTRLKDFARFSERCAA